ncbi:MAG TPA: AMP-binding protein, partial [Aestuariivirgaceae bacterium]|nr:AMP-binding protein [Aestuariivirgaceae bacterium]
AVVHGDWQCSYAEFQTRVNKLANALKAQGIGRGDTVSAMLPNVPAMLELHYAVPMLGAVLNTINTRLDAETVAYILDHGESRALFADREYSAVIGGALDRMKQRPLVVDIDDPLFDGAGDRHGISDYEAFIAGAPDDDPGIDVQDEWQAIALNYTSGTTGRPKGVVYTHRGTYLEALGNIVSWEMPGKPVYLWTLPLFHCNGWCFGWSVVAMSGTHVCLRRIDPALIFSLIARHGVTHMCGAPTVLNMLCNAPDEVKVAFDHPVHIQTGGASPPKSVIRAMEDLGFSVMHIYGLTEMQGPSTLSVIQDDWRQLPVDERAGFMARQGVPYVILAGQMVADPDTLEPVPEDGQTMGEVLMRGNTVMKGYLKDAEATEKAFRGGWFHSGDLAVQHADGYMEIKDRSKDIIISGGENISTVEIEAVLFQHPAVLEAAVVAAPDDKWGETPCAFVTLRPGKEVTAEEITEFCRSHMARFKAPRKVVFCELPKTATGKVQKFELREQARQLA